MKIPPVLVIKPKENECDKDIGDEIKNVINPLNDPVTSMRRARNNKIVIQCNDERSVETIKSKLNEKFGSEFDVDRAQQSKPRIKIFGIYDYENDSKLIEYLSKQNPDVITSANSLKVIHVNKLPTYTSVIVETVKH